MVQEVLKRPHAEVRAQLVTETDLKEAAPWPGLAGMVALFGPTLLATKHRGFLVNSGLRGRHLDTPSAGSRERQASSAVSDAPAASPCRCHPVISLAPPWLYEAGGQ
uniref:Uncharacterized protein n=1 Tax=Alexandrium andersonii TaxID=327968 RepID=A0A7S2CKF8_9DINO|mmetsp:Transcript_39864/g.90651  ORF Transcript_39864/g.90651 Transcript_39864/m.90651 type:complete len:107 (+) Transcript_39864:104-424(+)